MLSVEQVQQDVRNALEEWKSLEYLMHNDIFVVGCSTSEVAGEHIGTSGSEQIAQVLFEEMESFKQETGVHLAFQGCEHINRALVIEREVLNAKGLDEVAVVPVRKAGGSMASYAYKHFKDPVMVEEITADAGIDIGDTLIGMHLKRVAVPVRLKQKSIGYAHVTSARTRPKLIGGARAVYERADAEHCD
ncbi:TIGR01440 family protein [Pontibacillus sp. HMF3514]|uniref:TIGR01440 family protein n=1 Tax=Pontibacillus sp. HMF3514 TaxID=2692425 RepID=UPI00131F54AA|nr:TIGR01440 family protein [Pontibacillus sp. HMF3514]QHE53808.1 TIGR01440 family protein [Pontibacillus sp. HMF3514]